MESDDEFLAAVTCLRRNTDAVGSSQASQAVGDGAGAVSGAAQRRAARRLAAVPLPGIEPIEEAEYRLAVAPHQVADRVQYEQREHLTRRLLMSQRNTERYTNPIGLGARYVYLVEESTKHTFGVNLTRRLWQ